MERNALFQPKVLVLFVHGFLGSESSFCSFPLDLVNSIRKQYKIQNIEARIFPFFETKGDPEKAINLLHNWLLLNASVPEYESVLIICHSMGGLIAVDAFRKLLRARQVGTKGKAVEKKEKHLSIATVDVVYDDLVKKESNNDSEKPTEEDDVPLEPEQKGWFSGLWSSGSKDKIIHAPLDVADEKQQIPQNMVVGDTLKSFPIDDTEEPNSYKNTTPESQIGESHVNIGAIIAFDSPFYGLSSSLFTRGAGDYSADLISDYVPSNHKETVSSTLKYTSEVTANAVESIPAIASSTVEAIPQATSTVVSTALLPITDPKKAAGIILYPVKQIPYALSSVASMASSYFVKGDKSTTALEPGTADSKDSLETKDAEKDSKEIVKKGSKLELKDGKLLVSGDSTSKDTSKLEKKGSKLELKDGKLVLTNNEHKAEKDVIPMAEKDIESVDPPKPKTAELLPIPRDTDWASWIGLGLSTAALATGAYYGGGLIVAGGYGIARTYAITYGMKHAESARQHLSFLYPIWGESQKACEERMEAVVEEMNKGKFTFKTYYIEIPREGGGEPRTFIKKPPPLTSYLFTPIGSDFGNEIGGHMNIFSREQNPGHYWNLIHQTAKDVRLAVEVARDKRF